MPSFAGLSIAALWRRRADRRNIDALAAKLGVSHEDAAWIYQRARAEGFGAAMAGYEERCRELAERARAERQPT